jgi:hypothetical protein
MRSSTTGSRPDRNLLILLLACVAVRAALWLVYTPATHSDTTDYRNFATMILAMDFTTFLGARTPAYPILLALCAKNDFAVWGVQSLLGVAISLMLYRIGRLRTGSARIGLALGLLYTFSLNLLFFEATILTECLATFFIVLSLLIYLELADAGRPRASALLGLAAGLATSLLWLTRPLFLFVPFELLLFAWVQGRRARRRGLYGMLASFFVPVAALYVGWCSFVHHHTGAFKPVTLTGLTLTQHTGGFMELAPEKYHVVRDIYLKHREHQFQVRGSHSMTIWDAEFDMMDSTGLGYAQLSDYLLGMSLEMIAQHPLLYLKSVASSWLHFWLPVNYYELSHVRWRPVALLLQIVWRAEKIVMIPLNALFLLLSARALYRAVRARDLFDFDTMVIALVLATSVVQALMEYGHNDRFAAPIYPLIYYVIIVEARRTRLYERLRARFGGRRGGAAALS